jgi:hypothetical protein
MKRLSMILAVCLLTAGAARAADEHDHADGSKTAPAAAPGIAHHDHMKLMREQLTQMRAAKDPKERERLMTEHMKTMEESMAKMGGMMGCGKMQAQ